MTKKLAECKGATPSTSHLVITYPDHPTAIDCVGPIPTASRPCDDTWNTERYNTQKWFETVPTICATDRACPAPQKYKMITSSIALVAKNQQWSYEAGPWSGISLEQCAENVKSKARGCE